MEREDRIRRYYELVDGGDVTGLVSLFAPDAVYRRPGYDPLVGRDDLVRFYNDQRVIKDGCHRLSEVVIQGDAAAVHGTFEGTLKDGSAVALRFADFFTFADGGPFSSRDTFFFVQMV